MIRMNETLFLLVINPQLTPDDAACNEGQNRPPTQEIDTRTQDGKKEKRATRPACIHHATELSKARQEKQHDVTNDNHLHNPLIQMRKTMLIFNRRANNTTGFSSLDKRRNSRVFIMDCGFFHGLDHGVASTAPAMAGCVGEPKGSPVTLTGLLTPHSLPPHLAVGRQVNNLLRGANHG